MTQLETTSNNNSKSVLTIAQVLQKFFTAQSNLLLAINLSDYQPRILTGTDDKRYIVLFSKLSEAYSENTGVSLLAMPAEKLMEMIVSLQEKHQLDGMIINPWGKRITISWQQVRDAYFQYKVLLYKEDTWWNVNAYTLDYDALMWDNGEPYDEVWLEEMLEAQNRKVINVAWWAQEQPEPNKKLPLFAQIWLTFYGLFWLQTIFAAGLNTLYNKEMDEASILQSILLSIGIYFIFKYQNRFAEWWDERETKKQAEAERIAWEAAAPEREAQAQLEAAIHQRALELIEKRNAEEQQALAALADDCK